MPFQSININAETVRDAVLAKVDVTQGIRIVVCGLSSSPFIGLAGVKMLGDLHGELASRGISFQIVGARGKRRRAPEQPHDRQDMTNAAGDDATHEEPLRRKSAILAASRSAAARAETSGPQGRRGG